MNAPEHNRSVTAILRQRLALWVGVAAFLGGVLGYFAGRSAREVVGGALIGAAAVLLVSWYDHVVDWARRMMRIARGTLIGLSVGAIFGAVLALVRKEGWLGDMLGGAVIGGAIGMFVALLIERHRNARAKAEAATPPSSPPAAPTAPPHV